MTHKRIVANFGLENFEYFSKPNCLFFYLAWFISCTHIARLFRGFDCLDTPVRPTRLAANVVNPAARFLRKIRIVPRVACAKGFLRSDQLCVAETDELSRMLYAFFTLEDFSGTDPVQLG
jgi:hypothetical protein